MVKDAPADLLTTYGLAGVPAPTLMVSKIVDVEVTAVLLTTTLVVPFKVAVPRVP